MLENLIGYHCGPALAGIKPANLVVCRRSHVPRANEEIEKLNGQLNGKDIYLDVVCQCRERLLVLVYRKKVLENHLKTPQMHTFLQKLGYPAAVTVEGYLAVLRSRLALDGFPHEIGIFLGYPLHDIDGFINHRDEGCLLVGEWRVYRDAENARKLFLRYRACRKAILRRVTMGQSLAEIFCAA